MSLQYLGRLHTYVGVPRTSGDYCTFIYNQTVKKYLHLLIFISYLIIYMGEGRGSDFFMDMFSSIIYTKNFTPRIDLTGFEFTSSSSFLGNLQKYF